MLSSDKMGMTFKKVRYELLMLMKRPPATPHLSLAGKEMYAIRKPRFRIDFKIEGLEGLFDLVEGGLLIPITAELRGDEESYRVAVYDIREAMHGRKYYRFEGYRFDAYYIRKTLLLLGVEDGEYIHIKIRKNSVKAQIYIQAERGMAWLQSIL